MLAARSLFLDERTVLVTSTDAHRRTPFVLNVDTVARLLARLDDHEVGEARMTILRDGRTVDVTVTLVGGA
jgi:hypothetical protein